jgi:hypothetical protein
MIEADRHVERMESSPASDEQKISDLECKTLGQRRRGGNAARCQITHNPAHTSTSTMAIVSAFRNPPIAASPDREALRFEAIGGNAAPCRLRNLHDPT